MRQLATRPWRDGSDVLRLGLRHVAEVFIVTPTGSLLAPNAIELLMNTGDLALLTETMDLEVINASATELYSAQVTARGARFASIGPVAASVTGVVPDRMVKVGPAVVLVSPLTNPFNVTAPGVAVVP